MLQKEHKRRVRHLRIKKQMAGHSQPRLVVFRSVKHIYGQVIDDTSRKTLVAASDLSLKGKQMKKEKAKEVGKLLAKKALEKNIKTVVFDRAGYKYHGRIKELAEGAREGGLEF